MPPETWEVPGVVLAIRDQVTLLVEWLVMILLGLMAFLLLVWWLVRRRPTLRSVSDLELRRMYARGHIDIRTSERELARRRARSK